MRANGSRFVVGATLALIAVGMASADEQKPARTQLAKLGKAATALVQVGDGRSRPWSQESFGSAFCVHESGLFVTNEHVINPHNSFQPNQNSAPAQITLVVNPGQTSEQSYAARIIRVDKELDLALLRVDGRDPFPMLGLGDDEKLEELMEVVAFGFPYGTAVTGAPAMPNRRPGASDRREYPSVSVNSGGVTALRRRDGILDRIQLDATLNPGNSGGPLLDKEGKVVGVVVSIAVAQGLGRTGIGSAIPVSHLQRFLSRPDIEFEPPLLDPSNIYKPVLFQARVIPIVPSKSPLTVELIVKANREEERSQKLEAVGNSYRATITPLTQPAGALRLRVLGQFENGLVNATATDQAVKVGDRSAQLSEIRLIRLKPQPRVVFGDGKVVEKPVSGLDAVPVQLGDQTLAVNLANAAEIKLAPAVETDEVLYTLVVREGDREILRQTDSLIVQGLLPSPKVFVATNGIKPPNLEGSSTVRKLPAALDDVVPGGGGRYLVLHLPSLHKLAVFDVTSADIVGYIPVKDAAARFAACKDYVVVFLPGDGTMERWALKDLKRDLTSSVALPGPVKALAMGCLSDGPLLVHCGPARDGNDSCTFALVNVENMKVIQSEVRIAPHMQHFLPSNEIIHIRASANGRLFGMWCTSHGPTGVGVIEVSDGGAQSYYAHWSVGHVVPGPDGKFLFTRSGRCEPRVNITDMQGPAGDPVLPACTGDYYLTLPATAMPGQFPGRRVPTQAADVKPATATVRALRTDRLIATLPDLATPGLGEDTIKNDLTFDKRLCLIPEARLVISIPVTNNRLILYPFGTPPATESQADADASSNGAPATDGRTNQPGLRNSVQSAFWPYTTSKGDGCFLRQGSEWLEVSEGKIQHRFKETARKPDYVEIYDEGRGMWLRLFADKVLWRQSGETWNLLPAKPNPPTAVPPRAGK